MAGAEKPSTQTRYYAKWRRAFFTELPEHGRTEPNRRREDAQRIMNKVWVVLQVSDALYQEYIFMSNLCFADKKIIVRRYLFYYKTCLDL